MERGLINEEAVTRRVIRILKENGWIIVSFDLPQMGTGIVLHKSGTAQKNKGSIIPDVFAYKNGAVLLCEAKSFFSEEDLNKLMEIKQGYYDASISRRLRKLKWEKTLIGIAYPKYKVIGNEDYKDLDYVFLIGNNNHEIIYRDNKKTI